MENNVHENKKLVRQANCSVGEWVTLGCCAEFINGDRGINYPKHSDYVEVGIPFINTGHITPEGWLDLDNMQYITHEKFTNLRSGKIRNGDIVYCLRGSTIGKIARVNLNEGAVASSLVIVRALDGIHQDYLFHFLSINYGQGGVTQYDNGSAQPNLSVNTISKFKIFLPPYETQVKIANFINAFDVKITLNHQINQTLEQMAQALFKSWFVDFDPVVDNALDAGFFEQDLELPDALLRRAEARQAVRKQSYFKPLPDATRQLFPAAFEECAEPSLGLGGWVPKGWKTKMLGDITSELRRGISPKYIENGGVKVINQKCIRNHELSYEAARCHDQETKAINGRALQLGDVLVNSTGVGTLGRIAQVTYLDETTVADSHVTVVRVKEDIFPIYTFGQLMLSMESNIERLGEGSTGQTELSRKILSEQLVVLPPSIIAEHVNKSFKSFAEKQVSNRKQNSELTKLRDTLLPKLISGELRLDNIKAELVTE